eukprot:Pgem_evm1s11350
MFTSATCTSLLQKWSQTAGEAASLKTSLHELDFLRGERFKRKSSLQIGVGQQRELFKINVTDELMKLNKYFLQ